MKLLPFPRRHHGLPVWAYVAEWQDNPTGPSWRGRCIECPIDLPVHQVPIARFDDAVIEAAEHGQGPVPEAAFAAYRDLARHLWQRHGIRVREPRPEQLTFHFRRAP